jgi:uncharacterized membrane protein YdjX (TVP38/TMEM64 family)
VNELGESAGEKSRRAGILRLVLLAVLLGVFSYGFLEYRDSLTLENIAERESSLREFQEEHPVGVYATGFLIYVAVTGFSLPGAVVLTLAYGWFFGFWPAFLIVSFASTTGASIAFLYSRYLLRDMVQAKFGDRLQKFNAALEREGAFYLFILRLNPVVPFFVINIVMGLTPIRLWTFYWVSQVGMLAGTGLYVYAGSTFPTATSLAENGVGGVLSPELIAALIFLGVFPLVVKQLISKKVVTEETEKKDSVS